MHQAYNNSSSKKARFLEKLYRNIEKAKTTNSRGSFGIIVLGDNRLNCLNECETISTKLNIHISFVEVARQLFETLWHGNKEDSLEFLQEVFTEIPYGYESTYTCHDFAVYRNNQFPTFNFNPLSPRGETDTVLCNWIHSVFFYHSTLFGKRPTHEIIKRIAWDFIQTISNTYDNQMIGIMPKFKV